MRKIMSRTPPPRAVWPAESLCITNREIKWSTGASTDTSLLEGDSMVVLSFWLIESVLRSKLAAVTSHIHDETYNLSASLMQLVVSVVRKTSISTRGRLPRAWINWEVVPLLIWMRSNSQAARVTDSEYRPGLAKCQRVHACVKSMTGRTDFENSR